VVRHPCSRLTLAAAGEPPQLAYVAVHDGARAGGSLRAVGAPAGVLEIGCGYLVWLWLREQRHIVLGIAGLAALALYGVVPVLQERTNPCGRVYAAYGAVFVFLSVLWGWLIDRHRPDVRDSIGAAITVAPLVVPVLEPSLGGRLVTSAGGA